jgi:hypothetical protein
MAFAPYIPDLKGVGYKGLVGAKHRELSLVLEVVVPWCFSPLQERVCALIWHRELASAG